MHFAQPGAHSAARKIMYSVVCLFFSTTLVAQEHKNNLLQARAYINSENTGHSYNLRSMAENMDVGFKDNNKWFQDYTNAYNTALSANADVAAAHQKAREAADHNRLQPGTAAFNDKLKQLQEINNWDIGAALKVKANLVHTEAAFDLGKLLHTNYTLQIGADFRDYIIVPDGNYFINPPTQGII